MRPQRGRGHPVLQTGPSAHRMQPDDHQRDQPGQDDEELQHLVVDRARQAAQRDVHQHEQRRGDHRNPDRPTDQSIDHQAEGKQIDARVEHRRQRESSRVEQVGWLVEPPQQVLRHSSHPGAVVERHHHQTQEHHRRNGADPIEMHRRQSVLRAIGRHAQDLQRTQIRGDESQPGDPGRQRAPRQQKSELVATARRASTPIVMTKTK